MILRPIKKSRERITMTPLYKIGRGNKSVVSISQGTSKFFRAKKSALPFREGRMSLAAKNLCGSGACKIFARNFLQIAAQCSNVRDLFQGMRLNMAYQVL